MKKLFNKKGMTLIEVLVTIAILAIVIQVGYSMFFSGNKSFGIGRDIGFVQQDVRNLATFLNSELRYVDKISTAITEFTGEKFSGTYYSIKLTKEDDDNGDDIYSIVRLKHESEDPDIFSEERIIARFTLDNPYEVIISYDNENKGKVNADIKKAEGDQDYSLNIDIKLENYKDYIEDFEVILHEYDKNYNTLYYSYPADYIEVEDTN